MCTPPAKPLAQTLSAYQWRGSSGAGFSHRRPKVSQEIGIDAMRAIKETMNMNT